MAFRAWYSYDSKNLEIKKKGLREVSIVSVKREFMKGMKNDKGRQNDEIVAQYMYGSGFTPEGEEIITVEFLHKDDLEDFLTKREKKGHSMLQRFVTPKGSYNGIVQAIWSPSVFFCERRQNLHKINDNRFTRFERAVTYEGPFFYSTQAFCAPKLVQQVEVLCKSIVDHVKQTEKHCISRMVLYFKVDPSDNVWLLYSNCIRIKDASSSQRSMMNLAQTYTPPAEMVIYKEPSKAPVGGSEGPTVPTVPTNLSKCANCSRGFDRDHGYPVPLHCIIKHHGIMTRSSHNHSPKVPTTVTLFDSSLLRKDVDDAEDLGYSAYDDVLATETSALLSKRARERKLGQHLFSQLDSVLYEAYSFHRMNTSHNDHKKVFHFTLNVDFQIPAHEKCVSALLSCPCISRGTGDDPQSPGKVEFNFDTPKEMTPTKAEVAYSSALAKFLTHATDSEPNGSFSRDPTLHPSSELLLRTNQSAQQGGDLEDSLTPIFLEIDWSSAMMSVLKLQHYFEQAKFAGEIEMYPHGHPRRRRLLEKQKAMEMKSNDGVKALSLSGSPVKPADVDITWITQSHMAAARTKALAANVAADAANVPTVIRQLLPTLSSSHFTYLAAEPAFVNQTVKCCEGCFLMFTDVSSRELHTYQADRHQRSKFSHSVQSRVDHTNTPSSKNSSDKKNKPKET